MDPKTTKAADAPKGAAQDTAKNVAEDSANTANVDQDRGGSTQVGTSGPDTLVGGQGADTIIGGQGNDTLSSLGGPTVDEAIATLRAEFEAKAAADEEENARLRADAADARAEADALRESMITGKKVERREDGKVAVRVKTPMLIHPSQDEWDYETAGVATASASLTAGLNYVDPWVADHWLVKGNLQED